METQRIKRTISLGKVAYQTAGRKTNAVEIEIIVKRFDGAGIRFDNLQTVEGYYRLSICGAIWNSKRTDCVSCGQNLEEIAKLFPHERRVQRIVEIWREWHLNDMQAGTLRQQSVIAANKAGGLEYDALGAFLASKDMLVDSSHPGKPYRYGTAWLVKPLPERIIEELGTI